MQKLLIANRSRYRCSTLKLPSSDARYTGSRNIGLSSYLSDGIINRGLAKYRSIPSGGILIMAALWNRAGHYIFSFFFLLFFPRLISAVADWMSTILVHMVWP